MLERIGIVEDTGTYLQDSLGNLALLPGNDDDALDLVLQRLPDREEDTESYLLETFGADARSIPRRMHRKVCFEVQTLECIDGDEDNTEQYMLHAFGTLVLPHIELDKQSPGFVKTPNPKQSKAPVTSTPELHATVTQLAVKNRAKLGSPSLADSAYDFGQGADVPSISDSAYGLSSPVRPPASRQLSFSPHSPGANGVHKSQNGASHNMQGRHVGFVDFVDFLDLLPVRQIAKSNGARSRYDDAARLIKNIPSSQLYNSELANHGCQRCVQLVGLSAVAADSTENLRFILPAPSQFDCKSDGVVHSWFGTKAPTALLGATVSRLFVDRENTAFGQIMDSPWIHVLASTNKPTTAQKPLDWLSAGEPDEDGRHVVRVRVSMRHTFATPPVLVLALREFDSWGFQAAGIHAEVEEIATSSFVLAVSCCHTPRLPSLLKERVYRADYSFLAMEAGPDVRTGIWSCHDDANLLAISKKRLSVQRAYPETLGSFEWRSVKATVVFDPPFEQGMSPKVFTAIMGMQLAGRLFKDIRVQVHTSQTTCHEEFTIVVSTRLSTVSLVQVQWVAVPHDSGNDTELDPTMLSVE